MQNVERVGSRVELRRRPGVLGLAALDLSHSVTLFGASRDGSAIDSYSDDAVLRPQTNSRGTTP